MSVTNTVVVGEKGRIVLPAQLREARGWVTGTTLVMIETETGAEFIARDDLEKRVLAEFAGAGDMLGALLAERRSEAAREDAGL